MGKGGSPKVEVTEYYMSEHFGICQAVPDALVGLTIKEKQAWSGSQSALGTISIDQPELFGGPKKEGGLAGTVHYLPGASDQVLPDALAQKLGRSGGSDCPGFRGLASIFLVGADQPGFYWTANTPYLPGVWATVQRILKRADGSAQWYPETAAISFVDPSADLTLDTSLWRYKRESYNSSNTYEDEDYDDSSWSTGYMPFGSEAWSNPESAGYRSPPESPYEEQESLHLRRTFILGQAVSSLSFSAFVDNGWTMWVNGVQVFTDYSAFGHTDSQTIDGSYFRVGSNTIYIKVVDDSAHNEPIDRAYFDLKVPGYYAGRYDMNPAHIIHECLTDTTWGMGTPVAALDDTAFTEAADTLYNEGFGLSMIWTRQASIQDFIQEVLDHIQAVLYVDPSTGLLTLKLIRDDYDEASLPELTPDNADLSSFSRKLWGDIVNEITVTWTNPENEQEETITVQDDASISIQGGPVSDSRNYYGVRSATLAQSLAWRDLRSAGQPLASCEAEVDRTQWQLRPASVVKVTWPEYSLSEVVMRVTSIDYGKLGDPTIKLSLVEDVYGLDIGTYDAPPTTEWTDPSADPEAIETVEIFTLPYYFALGSPVAEFLDSPEYPEVVAGVLATTDSDDTFEYELWDEVTLPNGSTQWQSLVSNNIIGYGELSASLDMEATSASVSFDNIIGQTGPTVGGFVIIGDDGETGNEIAMVDADDGDYDLVRGVLDTVPRAWPAGTPVWFVDASTLYEDTVVRSAAETVDYKLLARTSKGLYALASATLESATLSERPWLPNRPANVTAYGEAWSSEASVIDARERPNAWVTVTWANRNRLEEDSQILAWTDASQTAEEGQTTTIEVRAADGTLLTTHDGLSGTSFDVPDASFSGEEIVRLRVYSERSDADGDFVSLQYFEHWVQVGDVTFDSAHVTFDSTAYTMDQD